MHRNLFKQNLKSKMKMQEERRKRMLEEQKMKRQLLQDLQRNVDEDFSRYRKKANYSKEKQVSSRIFKDANDCGYSLQLSEWMREPPDNLCDWFLVPCPKGQRCLLIASNGRTDMYSKAGRKQLSFHTLLPGDGGSGGKMSSLLDCVYAKDKDTIYVLDALVYGNQELIHCEAQFRFFWLRSKFAECEELSIRNPKNDIPLKLLEHYDFEDNTTVSEALQRFPLWSENKPELDGMLFYHKEASYTCGTTPLVGWLFAFMVPDVLGMPVNENYQRPANYTEPNSYIAEFDAALVNQKSRRKQTRRISTDMEITESLYNENDLNEEESYGEDIEDTSLDAESEFVGRRFENEDAANQLLLD